MAGSRSEPPATKTAANSVQHSHSGSGLASGIAAYTLWGIFPIYFHALAHVAPLVILCHRIVWSVWFLGLVISVRREWRAILQIAGNVRIPSSIPTDIPCPSADLFRMSILTSRAVILICFHARILARHRLRALFGQTHRLIRPVNDCRSDRGEGGQWRRRGAINCES